MKHPVNFCIAMVMLLPVYGALAQESPYAGQETRSIKALSASEIKGYLTGKGMGFAKAAELNHHPGPKHVLDLANELELTKEQLEQTRAIFASMKKQAVKLGKQLVAKERRLDQMFASGTIDAVQLKRMVMEIGSLKAKLRYVHLQAHLRQKDILSPHQVKRYDQLRGYGKAAHGHDYHHEE
ncbi:MAG: Spy/CpxP family protein refolding chaperone [candidate division KSB1 bacterium]|nr:Spy/CpxP family protein refolding chaperone [candidate division KSB1 bacterium]